MSVQKGALKELLEIPDRRDNPYVKKWHTDGKYVIGYMCNYVPEEIIWATGMLPYRLEARDCAQTDEADVWMHRFNCSYTRSILQLGLTGEYDFLDGICFLNGCDQMRRTYELLASKAAKKPMWQGMIAIPHYLGDNAFKWYKEELYNIKEDLRSYFGAKKVTDEELWDAIILYNKSRKLIGKLYDLRKEENPRISGADAFKLTLAAFYMDRNIYNKLLEEALGEIEKREPVSGYRARIMIGGSALDDPSFIELIEGRGGLVVTDTMCFGTRFFFDLVEEKDGDPMEALAKRYFYHNPCPRMVKEYGRRMEFTEDLARGAKVDGVILERMSFCDLHGVDSPTIAKDLETMGIPAMVLEKEYYMLPDVGRFQTRVEAFIERIEG